MRDPQQVCCLSVCRGVHLPDVRQGTSNWPKKTFLLQIDAGKRLSVEEGRDREGRGERQGQARFNVVVR